MISFFNIISILIICFTEQISLVNKPKAYYFSNNGVDNNTGTSPTNSLKTLKKLNSLKLNDGDSILFKCDDIFYGKLKIANDNIFISSYGNGNLPIIDGSEKIKSSWKLENGIWYTNIFNVNDDIRFLVNENNILPISRYPNKNENNGYLNFESHDLNNSITDNDLKTNWNFSDMVIRTERFRMAKVKTQSQKGQTLNFLPNEKIDSLKDNYGYFFVNSNKAIDLEGEWAYSKLDQKIYYKSKINPNNKSISCNKIDSLLIVKNANNINVRNISFKNAGKNSINITNCKNVNLNNIKIQNSGGDGITLLNSSNCTIKNSFLNQINWSGIFSSKTCDNITIQNNSIKNVGNEAFPKSKTFIGIDCNSAHSSVLNNTITNTGYSGIISAGVNNQISNNIIDNACTILDDNGGIYLNNNINKTMGTIVSNNMISNVIGDLVGAPAKFSLANGIYLDNFTEGVLVASNTISDVNGTGIYSNKCQTGNKIIGNTIYNCLVSQIFINNPLPNPKFIIDSNVMVANSTTKNQKVIRVNLNKSKDYDLGTITHNIIINPNDTDASSVIDGYKIKSISNQFALPNQNLTEKFKTLFTNNKSNSILFLKNSTNSKKQFSLPSGIWINQIKSKKFQNSIMLDPLKSVVLFKTDS